VFIKILHRMYNPAFPRMGPNRLIKLPKVGWGEGTDIQATLTPSLGQTGTPVQNFSHIGTLVWVWGTLQTKVPIVVDPLVTGETLRIRFKIEKYVYETYKFYFHVFLLTLHKVGGWAFGCGPGAWGGGSLTQGSLTEGDGSVRLTS
jgi:hypothetical protein